MKKTKIKPTIINETISKIDDYNLRYFSLLFTSLEAAMEFYSKIVGVPATFHRVPFEPDKPINCRLCGKAMNLGEIIKVGESVHCANCLICLDHFELRIKYSTGIFKGIASMVGMRTVVDGRLIVV